MSLTLTYNNPAFPKGTELGMAGIGTIKNGEPRELTEGEERAYMAYHGGKGIKSMTEGNEMIELKGKPLVAEETEENGEETEAPEGEEEEAEAESTETEGKK